MSPYIPPLKRQHEEIENHLNASLNSWQQKDIPSSRAHLNKMIYHVIEHTHDENLYFFEKLRKNPRSNEGGPFCSYFFELFMQNRPLMIAAKLISEYRGTKTEIAIPAWFQHYFSENSLLTIPIEEHLSIQALSEELSSAFDVYNPKDNAWIDKVFDHLKDMVSTNHKKEETCLWAVAEQIMEKQTYQELALAESRFRL